MISFDVLYLHNFFLQYFFFLKKRQFLQHRLIIFTLKITGRQFHDFVLRATGVKKGISAMAFHSFSRAPCGQLSVDGNALQELSIILVLANALAEGLGMYKWSGVFVRSNSAPLPLAGALLPSQTQCHYSLS